MPNAKCLFYEREIQLSETNNKKNPYNLLWANEWNIPQRCYFVL